MNLLKLLARRFLDKTVKQHSAGSYMAYQFGRRIVSAFENHDVDMTTNGERWLIRSIASRKLHTAVDIGANQGEWSEALLEYAPQAKLVSFEPVQATFANLQSSIQGPNVTLVNKAVSSEPGTLVIHAVADNPYLASVNPGELCQPELERVSIDIQAVTGLQILQDYSIDHVDVVKIDVEGHDFDALKGFGPALEDGRIDFIQFEYNAYTLESRRMLNDFFKLLAPRYLVCRLLPEGLEACGYNPTLDNFGQSNWVAVRIDALDRDWVQRLSIRRARGLPGDALTKLLSENPKLAELI